MSRNLFESGSRFVKYSRRGVLGVMALAGLCMMRPATASAQLIESFEGTLDGWTFNASNQNFTSTYSTTTGVTNGTQSLEIDSGTSDRTHTLSGFGYGDLMTSPRTAGLAALMAGSTLLRLISLRQAARWVMARKLTLTLMTAAESWAVPDFSHLTVIAIRPRPTASK